MDHLVHVPFHFVVSASSIPQLFYPLLSLTTMSAIFHIDQALAVIEGALDILKQLSSRAKMGATSYSLLWKLVTLLPVVDNRRVTTDTSRSSKRVKTNPLTPESLRHSTELSFTEVIEAPALQHDGRSNAVAAVSTLDNSQWIEDPTLQQLDFSSFLNSDFGGQSKYGTGIL